jgi:hypothetical protein
MALESDDEMIDRPAMPVIRQADLDGTLHWHTPPARHGQTVEVSYAGTFDGRVLRRSNFRSVRSITYQIADLAEPDETDLTKEPAIDGEWQPCILR